jgi:UDP-GlcNAc:undecaprenyl-phosphate/decaprenyl-phosphate GlcNAc-1-phosphate transferase
MEFEGLVVLVAVSTLCGSAALVPVSRWLARRLGVMDPPGERKIHSVPMPRLGGLAVFLSFTFVVLCGYLLLPMLLHMDLAQALLGGPLLLLREAPRVKAKLLAIVLGASLCFGVGLLDDVLAKRFPVWAKASGQLLAALLVTFADVRILVFQAEWLNVVVTLLWLVGITNAFNLLDNMDGLCAGVALVASGVFLLHAWHLGEYFICLLLAAFMGSLLGFLWFNFHPAWTFLGDCGSLFIGFVMGSLTLLERYVTHASSSLFPVLMPVLVLAVPIVDTVTVVIIRLREGRPIYVGDRCHLSHRLHAVGLSQRATVLFLYLMTFALGLGAASLTNASLLQSLLILLHSLGFVVLVLWLLFLDRAPAGVARS